MIKMKLSKEEMKAIEYVERRDYDGLERYLKGHDFDSGLLKAIWNSARRENTYNDKCKKAILQNR